MSTRTEILKGHELRVILRDDFGADGRTVPTIANYDIERRVNGEWVKQHWITSIIFQASVYELAPLWTITYVDHVAALGVGPTSVSQPSRVPNESR